MRLCLVALLGMGAVACGDETKGGGAQLCDAARDAYPAGPYGTNENQVMADLQFTKTDGSTLDLSEFHADPDVKLLLISTAAGWCTACVEEQPILQDLYTNHASRGLMVMVAYFEDASRNAATPQMADSWRQQYGLTFPVVADGPFVLANYYDENLTPMNMFVDVGCMKISRISTGFDQSATNAVIEAKL